MQVRKAKIADLGAILALNKKLFNQDFGFDRTLDTGWSETKEATELIAKNINEEGKYLSQVADHEGKVIGCMICRLMKTPTYMKQSLVMAELDHVYIETEFRNTGIGTEMFKNFEKWAKERGCNLLTVTAAAKNVLAKDFYTKVGFEPTDLTFQKKI